MRAPGPHRLLTLAALLLALGSAGCCGCRHRHAEPAEEDEKKDHTYLLERASPTRSPERPGSGIG